MILDTISGSQFSYDAGAAASVTVPAGCFVTRVICRSSAGGTLTITAKGPNQAAPAVAGTAIPIIANAPPFQLDGLLGILGPGSILLFTTTDSYYVEYVKMRAGG